MNKSWIDYKMDGKTEKSAFIQYPNNGYGGKGFFLNSDLYQPTKYLGGSLKIMNMNNTKSNSHYLPLQPTPLYNSVRIKGLFYN